MKAKLLETLIRQGHKVAVKNDDGYWSVFMFINGDGRFQGTYTEETIEECLSQGLYSATKIPEEIESNFTDEYKVITTALLMLEVGDTVEILENCREYAEKLGWSQEKINMIGQKGLEIKEVNNLVYQLYNNDKSDYFYFPSRAVAKCEEVSHSGKEVTVTIDGKEYTAVIK